MRRLLRETAVRVGLAGFGVVLALAVVEGALRAAGAVFLWRQSAGNLRALAQGDDYRILCLGESTTALLADRGYPTQLAKILNQRMPGRRFAVINRGVPAITTPGIVADLARNLDRYRPHAVVTMMGINDSTEIDDAFQISGSFRVIKLLRLARTLARRRAEPAPGPCRPCSASCRPGVLLAPTERDELRAAGDRDVTDPAAVLAWVRRQRQEGAPAAVEARLLQVLERDPGDMSALVALGDARIRARRPGEAKGAFELAVRAAPSSEVAACKLASFHAYGLRFADAIRLVRGILDRHGATVATRRHFEGLHLWLAAAHEEAGRLGQARRVLLSAHDQGARSARIYRRLGRLSRRTGDETAARRFSTLARAAEAHAYGRTTRASYAALKAELDRRGIQLVAVQYPMRPLAPLRRLLADHDDVIFVDNEPSFEAAVARSSYNRYFTDAFAGDFGHMTPVGAKLLASNVADALLDHLAGQDRSRPASSMPGAPSGVRP